MSVREYIGARYVPVFADPIQWDPTLIYEPLTVVTDQGASYVSRRMVPEGIQLDNTDYWILWADFNAQLQHYIDEVNAFDGRIDDLEAKYDADGKLEDNLVISDSITDGSVTTAKLAASAVTTAKIADGAITPAKLSSSVIKDKIAVIGDSFSKHVTGLTKWPDLLESYTGKTVVNLAEDGVGFITGAQTFAAQLQTLKDNYTMSEFSDIFVYGGINDFTNASMTLTDMKTAFDAFRTSYNAISGDKPKLHFAFSNVGRADRQATFNYTLFLPWVKELMTYLRGINMPGLIDNAYYWHFEDAYYNFNNDNLHPNELGQRKILSYMMQVLNGSYDGVHFEERYTASDIITTGLSADSSATGAAISVHFDNGIVSINAKLPTMKPAANNTWERLVNATRNLYSFGPTNNLDESWILPNKILYISQNANLAILNYEIAFNLTQSENFYIRTIGSTTEYNAISAGNKFSGCMTVAGN